MPVITSAQVKEKRNLIKKAFPQFKISVTKRHCSEIHVSILAGPVDMLKGNNNGRDYVQVNHYYIDEHYKEQPEIKEVLTTINDIAGANNYEVVYDSDYGSVPKFYVSIHIGEFDKPFQLTA